MIFVRLLIFAFLLGAAPAWAAIVHVQDVTAACGTGATVVTSGVTTTTSNFVVAILIGNGGNADTIAMSDSKSNTWTEVSTDPFTVTARHMRIYYSALTTGGSSHTFTATPHFSGTQTCIFVGEFSGIATSSPVDQEASGETVADYANITTANTATTAQADELLIGGATVTINAGSSLAAAGSYTLGSSTTSGNVFGGMEWRIVSATGAYAAAFTTTNNFWAARIVTFKGAAAAVNTEFMRRHRQ